MWAEQYLEARAVPKRRLDKAELGLYGLGDLLTVPLFAEKVADRLLDGADVPEPLDVLVRRGRRRLLLACSCSIGSPRRFGTSTG
jgi:hypothetical protein